MATPNLKAVRLEAMKVIGKATDYIGAIAVKRMQDNFRVQGWRPGNIVYPWPNRKAKEKSKKRRSILIKSGNLRRSVRIISKGFGRVKIGTTLSYSKIHNEGGTINTTQSVGEYTRRAHTRSRGRGKKKISVKQSKVSAHTRKINTKIPKRRFVGPSSAVMKEGNDWIVKEFDKVAKKWQ